MRHFLLRSKLISPDWHDVALPRRAFDDRIMHVDCYNNRRDLPRCNVARANKSKPEITRCDVTSIFRWFRPLRVEPSSFPLLLRTVVMTAHVCTHTRTTRAHLYSICNSKRTPRMRHALILPTDPVSHPDDL